MSIFCASVIQTLINKVLFKNRDDDGVKHPEFSEKDALPMVAIAFVMTLVSLLLEWHSIFIT